MAYIAPSTVTTGDLITAAKWNQDVVANIIALVHLERRQGGDATDWSVGGTTAYTPPEVRVEVGTYAFALLADSVGGSHVVTYPVAFSAAPIVFLYCGLNGFEEFISTSAESASGFTMNITLNIPLVSPHTYSLRWIAIGPA